MSETGKYREFTRKYCFKSDGEPGCGIDLASQGDPVVPWAWQLDLPQAEFDWYNSKHQPSGPIQLRGHAETLTFIDSESLDFVYSSHLLEDYLEWEPVLKEWVRVIKIGGKLIIMIPDKDRWSAAIANGQPPNCSHKHESHPGEVSEYAERIGCKVIEDRFTNTTPEDYNVLAVLEKIK